MSNGKQRADDIDLDQDEMLDESGQFIAEDEIYAEVNDDGDQPMDEDDDDEADQVGDLPEGSGSNVPDNSLHHFPDHNASVFTVAVHPTQPLAASGGEDDLGYIWDITDGEVIVKLTGHTDSVSAIGWSFDGEMIATGGMDGKIRVWRRVGKENYRMWGFLTELQGPDEVIFLRWHPKGNVLLAGSQDSTLWLWQLPSGNTMQVFAGHSGPVNCGEFTPDGKRILSACSDGTLAFWDPRSPTPVFKISPDDARFDLDGITSIGINPSSTLAVIGGGAGALRVVNLAKGEVIGSLLDGVRLPGGALKGKSGGHSEGESIEGITFVDLTGSDSGPGVVVTGASDGKICIWDLSTMRLRANLEHADSVTTLLTLPAPNTHLFVSASADKTLKTWNARTGALVKDHTGHHGPVLAASLGLNGSVVVSAGDDGVCLVFTTEPEEQ